MGGQQFGRETLLIDVRSLSGVGLVDRERGIVEVGAGAEWPEVIRELIRQQSGDDTQWGIAQKQTGTDRLTIGGALAANAHGRGLRMKPIIGDVESFEIVNASGEIINCSRAENSELFGLVIGGYGLFGVVASVRLRLKPRIKVERVVVIEKTDQLPAAFERRIDEGFLYGDFQFSIDEDSDRYLREGIFSCYRPVDLTTPMVADQRELKDEDWEALIHLAHTDEAEAYLRYSRYYLSTSGQVYWSDEQQLGAYFDGYHVPLDRKLKAASPGSEMITEIYVPRDRLVDFLEEARADFLGNQVDLIYGTIRLIERDEESFLSWATKPWACVIFNLHVDHTDQGVQHAAAAFRRLIDLAIARSGSYYLTYHRWATRWQVESCYPRFRQFLQRKRQYDPQELFQSDWYRHYRAEFKMQNAK